MPPVTKQPDPLKKFTAQIIMLDEDEIDDELKLARYELEALDIRAAALCARDRFEASEPKAPALYIVRVWQDFPVEVETRRVARMKGEE
jgi:hypothetical protein